MSSSIGRMLKLTVFGQSHSFGIGCSLDGVPAGYKVDFDELQRFLDRRAPGRSDTSTMRFEPDIPKFYAGFAGDVTCGAPIAAFIENTNTRSQDYDELRRIPRPGHADYPALVKYRGYNDFAGGGHFSGRLTAPLCIAGGIALQILAKHGIRIVAHIEQVGEIHDRRLEERFLVEEEIEAIGRNELPCISRHAAEGMHKEILNARDHYDSIGGVVECAAYGVPLGVGDPMFDGLENRIAQVAFGIPAVKGVEFGAGFYAARMRGSEHNDPYRMRDGRVTTPISNNAGGILGGISTGSPVVWRMVVKPTSSIARGQKSVDLETGEDAILTVRGRHDPCIVPRAVPVAEAACAFALLDAMLEANMIELPAPKRDIPGPAVAPRVQVVPTSPTSISD